MANEPTKEHHHMRRPDFQWSISFGSVMQMLITVAVVAGGFYTIDQRSQNNANTIDKIESRVDVLDTTLRAKIDSSIDPLETRVRLLETQNARSDERLNSILNIVTGINEKLERIESRVNNP